MYVSLVHVHVHPEAVDTFIDACRANHEASIQEPGNRRFDVLQHPTDKTRFILYEAYVDATTAQAHKETAHYLTWRENVAALMAEPRRSESMLGLFPSA